MLSEATSGLSCSAGCSRSSTVMVGAPPVVRLTTTFEAALIAGKKRMNIFGSCVGRPSAGSRRSEDHTSELQSQSNLVCRLLLEKKQTINISIHTHLQPTPRLHIHVI